MSGEITPSLNLIASYAYTDTKITQDNSGNEGNRLLNSPRNSGSVWGVYSFDQTPLQGLKLGAGVFAVGEREGNNENTFQLPDYVRVDLLVAYEWQLGPSTLTAQLNIENLADETYFNPAAPFQAFVAPGAPRTFIGSLRLEF